MALTILSKLCISWQCSLNVLTRKTGACPQCEEPAWDMLGAGGKPARLGLGKPRAFLAVGLLGGRYPTRSNQFLITINNKDTYHLFNWNCFSLIHLHGLIHGDHSRPDSRRRINRSQYSRVTKGRTQWLSRHHRNSTLPGFGFRALGTRWTI